MAEGSNRPNEPSAEAIARVTNGRGSSQEGRLVFDYILWMRDEIERLNKRIEVLTYEP